MFYKQITDKESLKIRNDIFIKDVVPILAKKGFIKSPFYTSCFGRTGNNGIYIYDMCRLRQCNLLEFVTTKISSRDRYIKIYVNTFALHPKIKEKYSLSEIDVTKYNIYPILRIPVDTRSLIPVISVHSISNLQYRRQS